MMYQVVGELVESPDPQTSELALSLSFWLLTSIFKVDERVSIVGVRTPSLPHRLLNSLLLSRDVVRCMMGYIVDMTIIMQALFWLMWTRFGQSPCPIGEEHLKNVVDKFKESATKREVHLKIWGQCLKWASLSTRNSAMRRWIRSLSCCRRTVSTHRHLYYSSQRALKCNVFESVY